MVRSFLGAAAKLGDELAKIPVTVDVRGQDCENERGRGWCGRRSPIDFELGTQNELEFVLLGCDVAVLAGTGVSVDGGVLVGDGVLVGSGVAVAAGSGVLVG